MSEKPFVNVKHKPDKNFIKRMPKINIYQEQLIAFNEKTLKMYKEFLFRKMKFMKPPAQVSKFLQELNFKQPEAKFFKEIRDFIQPPKTEQQYERPLEVEISRGKKRAEMFLKLWKTIPQLKDVKLSVGLDDACGSGVISKVFAQTFGLKRIDMYEPFVPELKYNIKGIESNFFSIPFDMRPKQQRDVQYDCVCLFAALHHIQNPLKVIQEIKESMISGGLLFVREHFPINSQQKMFLDVCEKSWSYGLTNEEEDGMEKIKNGTYPPQAYFFEKELIDFVGEDFRLLGKLREDNYIVNEFMNYCIFKYEPK